MAFQIDIRSLCIGLLVGLVVLLAVGAVKDEGDYRLSVTSCDGYVIYGRIHTGRIETWSHIMHSQAVPHLGNNTEKLVSPK